MTTHPNPVASEPLSPAEYFARLKAAKQTMTDEVLQQLYDNCLTLLRKYMVTNQVNGARKLMFHLKNVERERQLLALGVDTFVYRDDVEHYIDAVAENTVKIIELERYERELPDEVVTQVELTKGVLDRYYVVFTDYTGREGRRTQQARERDPILFGVFQDPTTHALVERFYFLGDWVDEYCDLTLDKLVNQMHAARHPNILWPLATPDTLAAWQAQLHELEPAHGAWRRQPQRPASFFKRVRTALGWSRP